MGFSHSSYRLDCLSSQVFTCTSFYLEHYSVCLCQHKCYSPSRLSILLSKQNTSWTPRLGLVTLLYRPMAKGISCFKQNTYCHLILYLLEVITYSFSYLQRQKHVCSNFCKTNQLEDQGPDPSHILHTVNSEVWDNGTPGKTINAQHVKISLKPEVTYPNKRQYPIKLEAKTA